MRLLVFEQQPDNRFGGQERSLFEVSRGLAERGVEITLAYQLPGNLLEAYAGFTKELVQLRSPYSFSAKRAPSFLASVIRLGALFTRAKWDVLYVNQYMDITLPAVLSLLIRRPVVLHMRIPPGPYVSRQYRWGLNRCERLIAISKHSKKTYAALGVPASRVVVIYNGTDLDYFKPGADRPMPDCPRLLCLARIVPEKGLNPLLSACASLASDLEFKLTIAGRPIPDADGAAYFAKLRQQAVPLGQRVEFIDHQEDIRPLLMESELLVLPSIWPEPYGRVLIEAMAAGLPVVATRVGGIPEVLGSEFDEFLVEPNDPEALAAAIRRHITWRRDRPDLGRRVREYVAGKFDGRRTIAGIHEVLLECSTAGSKPRE